MEKKNVKGFVGLFAGLLSFVCIFISLIPMEKIIDSNTKFYGSTNTTLAVIAAVLGIVAIVAGAMSKKDSDKKGPRKSGVIIGIFAVIISLIAAGTTAVLSTVTDYANGKDVSAFESLDDSQRETLDELVATLKNNK